MSASQENLSLQKKIMGIVVVLFFLKLLSWFLTHSVAILTDTLEYTINVVSGFIGLYSLYFSAKPKDKNHPYGHGKIEFISAIIEGTLILISSVVIFYEAVKNIWIPKQLHQLDYGIYLIAFTAIINFIIGAYAINQGKKNHSLALQATGKHLQSDTYGTIGIVLGLIVIHFTNYLIIDSLIAMVFAVIIFVSGYRILRSSVAGIMDEADEKLLYKMVNLCQNIRQPNWIDLHNLRIIKYGGTLHLDCHLTVPWYLNIQEGHNEVEALSKAIRDNFGERIELFVHTDACLDFSCQICNKQECPFRQRDFIAQVFWSVANISADSKHQLSYETIQP